MGRFLKWPVRFLLHGIHSYVNPSSRNVIRTCKYNKIVLPWLCCIMWQNIFCRYNYSQQTLSESNWNLPLPSRVNWSDETFKSYPKHQRAPCWITRSWIAFGWGQDLRVAFKSYDKPSQQRAREVEPQSCYDHKDLHPDEAWISQEERSQAADEARALASTFTPASGAPGDSCVGQRFWSTDTMRQLTAVLIWGNWLLGNRK